MLDGDAPLERRHRAPDFRSVAHRAKHQFGLGRGRNDVWRHAAGDEPDGVMRAPEHWVGGQLDRSQLDERIEERVDCRHAQLGE